MLSRLLGFVRDILMAIVLGTGPAADAFFAAFRFPNLFRRLFAEGAFNAAFIPLFSKALAEGDREAARDFAGRILSWLIGFLVILTILVEIFMPYVLVPFVPGFLDDPEKYELTVFLTRICFPYLACMSLMAAYGGILNSFGKFLVAAAAPVLLNVVLVGMLGALVVFMRDDPYSGSIWVSLATVVGGVAQLALVWWAVTRTGFVPKFTLPRFDREVRRFWLLALPAILTGGVIQINIFIGTIIASQADSAISYLYYADRMYQLPLGIIGIAIGVVLLPELSSHLKNGREAEAAQAQDQSLTLSMLLSVPAAAALFTLATPMISVLFQRGAFGYLSTTATSDALMAFSFGLPAFVLVKVFQPGFFAREDTLTPTVFAGISVVVNIGLSLALFPAYQHVGIAIATSVAAWVNVVLLAATLLRRGFLTISVNQWRRQGLIVLLSAVMAAVLWFAANQLAPALSPRSPDLVQFAALGALVTIGLLIYLGLVHLTGVQRLSRLGGILKRG